MMRLMRKLTRVRRSSRLPLVRRASPRLEELESRVVLYTVSGNAWPMPQLITLSFVPDGTNLGGVYSNLFATFNAKWATSTWENQILKGAQVWAQQTNINFSLAPDSGADIGSGDYQQGNPAMGDIRIGGFNFGSSALGWAYMPPPVNNYSVAGDFQFNTGQPFSIGAGGYDLFTVAAHEIGHALGLYHSSVSPAVMYATYNGLKSGLNSDDTAGIRNIYSNNNARSYDAFNGSNNSFSTAANLTGLLDANSNVLETGLNIANTSLKEYFTISAPSNTNGTMTVTVQSSGLSLLAPTLTVYNAGQTQIGYASGAGHYGTTVTVNITGVSVGQQFYVKIAGADSTAFGTGNYAMTFEFAGIAPPPVPWPNTQVLNGNPIMGGGGMGEQGDDARGRDTAWDTFGPTDDDATPAKAPTVNPASTGNAQSAQAASGPELVFVLATTSNQNATLFFAPAVIIPVSTVVPSQANIGRVESGGGNNSIEGVPLQDQVEQSAPLNDEEAGAPASVNAGRTETATERTCVPSVSWRQACDACFADEPRMADSTGASEGGFVADNDGVATLVEPAAAVAMLALLGDRWSAHPEQFDRPIRRSRRLQVLNA